MCDQNYELRFRYVSGQTLTNWAVLDLAGLSRQDFEVVVNTFA